jgi:hypothetical protein
MPWFRGAGRKPTCIHEIKEPVTSSEENSDKSEIDRFLGRSVEILATFPLHLRIHEGILAVIIIAARSSETS